MSLIIFKFGFPTKRYCNGAKDEKSYMDKCIKSNDVDIVDNVALYENCTKKAAVVKVERNPPYDTHAVQDRRQQHINYICAKQTFIHGTVLQLTLANMPGGTSIYLETPECGTTGLVHGEKFPYQIHWKMMCFY